MPNRTFLGAGLDVLISEEYERKPSMSEVDLTLGVLPRIFGGENVPEPVLQVLGHKEMANTKDGQKKFRLILNDGKYINSFVMLSPKLGHLVQENVITTYVHGDQGEEVCVQ